MNILKNEEILSTDLKKMAGFGKGRQSAGGTHGLPRTESETRQEKNYPGIITNLQMQLYLVNSDFRKRRNRKGNEYGMAVSIMLPPEVIWGYDLVTSAYDETPQESWKRIYDHVLELFEEADESDVIKLIGKAC